MYIGVSCVEIKTEADSNDINESSHDVKPSTGMFAISNGIFSAFRSRCGCVINVIDYRPMKPGSIPTAT